MLQYYESDKLINYILKTSNISCIQSIMQSKIICMSRVQNGELSMFKCSMFLGPLGFIDVPAVWILNDLHWTYLDAGLQICHSLSQLSLAHCCPWMAYCYSTISNKRWMVLPSQFWSCFFLELCHTPQDVESPKNVPQSQSLAPERGLKSEKSKLSTSQTK